MYTISRIQHNADIIYDWSLTNPHHLHLGLMKDVTGSVKLDTEMAFNNANEFYYVEFV